MSEIHDVDDDTYYEGFPRIRHASLKSLDSLVKSFDDVQVDQDNEDADRQKKRSNDGSIFKSKKEGNRESFGTTAKVKKPGNESAKKDYYSGVTHSDLDVQTSRPPLMYQMDVCEWLWLHSTAKQRLALIMLGLLLVIFILHFALAIWLLTKTTRAENPYICKSESCESLAKRIKSRLNRSVDPCVDFYGFVCGSSSVQTNLSEREEKYWVYGFDEGNIVYDFDYSVSLGSMLKPTKIFPENLVLTMYKGCLEEKKRGAKGLQPYYTVLKKFGLYNISKDTPFTADYVIESMAKILAHSFKEAAIVRVEYFVGDDNLIQSYIEPATMTSPFLRGGSVHRHGYKLYLETITQALSLVRDELKISDEEFFILPHDFLCIDFYFHDLYFPDDLDDPRLMEITFGKQNFTHPGCDLGVLHTKEVTANFKIPGMGIDFDGNLLVSKLLELGAHSKPSYMSTKNPMDNIRTVPWFVNALHAFWKRAAPIRLLRYFQWRVLYDLSFELNQEMIDVMTNIRRYSFSGTVTNCFHNLFHFLPFVAPNRFFQQIPEKRLKKIEAEFEAWNRRLKSTHDTLTSRSSFSQMQTLLKINFTRKQRALFGRMMRFYTNSEEVPPVFFKADNFPGYAQLYTGISLTEGDHVDNLIKMGIRMHEWRVHPDFHNTYWGIDPIYHTRIWVDKMRSVYDVTRHSVRNYLPIGSVEVPFLHEGLAVSDAGGLGMNLGIAQERAFVTLLDNFQGDRLFIEQMASKGYKLKDVGAMKNYLKQYLVHLKNQIQNDLKNWTIEDISWAKINDDKAMKHILEAVLMDEGRYEAVVNMVNDYLQEPENKKEAKYVLRGLEEFNSKKLYYISLVNRRCEKLGRKKFEFITKFGPLSQSVRNNIQLSYQDDFALTFKCPNNSKMNPSEKVYFHDRHVDTSSTINNRQTWERANHFPPMNDPSR